MCVPLPILWAETLKPVAIIGPFASFIYLCLKSQELVYFILPDVWLLEDYCFHVYCPIEKNMFQVGGQIETLFCQKVKVESEVKNI